MYTHLKKGLPYLIIRQVLSIPLCVDKTKEIKITKANPCIKVIGGPSSITKREEAKGERFEKKRVFYKVSKFFTLSPSKNTDKIIIFSLLQEPILPHLPSCLQIPTTQK